jgi:hypothetical protein
MPWVLMDKEGYIAKCMNVTTALGPYNGGVAVEVSFCLTDPLSYLCAHCLGLEGRTKYGG